MRETAGAEDHRLGGANIDGLGIAAIHRHPDDSVAVITQQIQNLMIQQNLNRQLIKLCLQLPQQGFATATALGPDHTIRMLGQIRHQRAASLDGVFFQVCKIIRIGFLLPGIPGHQLEARGFQQVGHHTAAVVVERGNQVKLVFANAQMFIGGDITLRMRQAHHVTHGVLAFILDAFGLKPGIVGNPEYAAGLCSGATFERHFFQHDDRCTLAGRT